MAIDSCPSCDAAVTVTVERQSFVYGVGDRAVGLSAEARVYFCAACLGTFTDIEMEEAKEAAIHAYLESQKGAKP